MREIKGNSEDMEALHLGLRRLVAGGSGGYVAGSGGSFQSKGLIDASLKLANVGCDGIAFL
ncbi:MAG: hypothetical protein HQL00_14185 [Nitrospirae bacterium]|nr:hypothetical protein [Nitrospirota bacterium]MBF0405103.1 hypothetical protein [Nitrospirota bacterium]